MTFSIGELELINDAIDMAIASNKRMQASKPKFAQIFIQIDKELQELKIKINTPVKK